VAQEPERLALREIGQTALIVPEHARRDVSDRHSPLPLVR
jgi:hypothetical protein